MQRPFDKFLRLREEEFLAVVREIRNPHRLIRAWNERLGLMERVFINHELVEEIPSRLPYRRDNENPAFICIDEVFVEMAVKRNKTDNIALVNSVFVADMVGI